MMFSEVPLLMSPSNYNACTLRCCGDVQFIITTMLCLPSFKVWLVEEAAKWEGLVLQW